MDDRGMWDHEELTRTLDLAFDDYAPSEWPSGEQNRALLSPERRLLLAVLEDAAATVSRNAGKSTSAALEAVREVEDWCSSGNRGSPFSFLNVCDAFGFDPSCTRAAFARLVDVSAMPERSERAFRIRRPLGGTRSRVVVGRSHGGRSSR